MRDWPTWLPDLAAPYLIIDTESTGMTPGVNRLTLLGYALVTKPYHQVTPADFTDVTLCCPWNATVWDAVWLREDFQQIAKARGFWDEFALAADSVVRSGSILGSPLVPQDVQEQKLKNRRQFLTAVDVTGITWQETTQRGKDPAEILPLLHSLMNICHDEQIPVIGHNLLRFDLPMLQAEFAAVGLPPARVDHERLIDTGLTLKALQMGWRPFNWSTRERFYRMIAEKPRRIKWALDAYAVPHYGLDRMGVDTARQHKSAGYDCFVVHCLLAALHGVPGPGQISSP